LRPAKHKGEIMETTMRQAYAARMRQWQHTCGWTKRRRYDEIGAVIDEIVFNCFGSPTDARVWAARLYAYPWMTGVVLDMAYALAAHHRDGHLRNPITAFHAWFCRCCPNPDRKGGAR